MENLRIDENSRWTLGGVANDGSGDIKNARVNPITGALIVEATVTSTNTQIGSTIPGGTAGSVLFLGLGGTLAQDNANFFYDDTNNYLGLGTTTPNATLDVQGTAIITGSAGTPTFVLGRDGSGNVSNIVLGSNLTLTGGVLNATASGSGYNQIQDNGTNITQRTTLNFVDYFTVTDGSSKTNVSINTAELGADTTLISTLETNMDLANISGQIDLSTQVTGTLSSTNIDITNLESNLDLANIAGQIDLTTQVTGQLSPTNIDVVALANDTTFISNLEPNLNLANLGGQIDLTTQVTGVLPLANGGTGQALTDPNYDAVYVWDDTTNTTRLAQLSGISYDSASNTLSTSGLSITNQIISSNLTNATITTQQQPISVNPINGDVWECNNPAGQLYKRYYINSAGIYQATLQIPPISCPTGNPFFQIYDNKAYFINYNGGANTVDFTVVDLISGTTLGTTNTLTLLGGTTFFGAFNITTTGRVTLAVGNVPSSGFPIQRVYEIDITSTLVIALNATYTASYLGGFSSLSKPWFIYKETTSNTNFFDGLGEIINYSNPSFPASLIGNYPVADYGKVLGFWDNGTNILVISIPTTGTILFETITHQLGNNPTTTFAV